jgi:hypothetical protein
VAHWPVMGQRDERQWCRDIERLHRDTARANGWQIVAPFYNYLVGSAGVYEGCGLMVRGIHSPPRNVDGFGVCFLQSSDAAGNNRGPLTAEMGRNGRALYEWLSDRCGRRLTMSWHGQHFATACPGPDIRQWVQQGMPAAPGPTQPPREEQNMVAAANASRADGSAGNANVFRITRDGRRVQQGWKGTQWADAGGGWMAGLSDWAAAPEGHTLDAIEAWNDNGVLTVLVRSAVDGSLWVEWQPPGSNVWDGAGPGRRASFKHFAR